MRRIFIVMSLVAVLLTGALSRVWPAALLAFWVLGPLIALGLYDIVQPYHAVRRNFPLIGRMRYAFEHIRPEIQQYFVESNSSGRPFSRQQRSVVYQRAKGVTDTLPFGTERDVYEIGYEWMAHSIQAFHPPDEAPRVRVGGPQCAQPYDASIFNISGMSFGALSRNAILALNAGAKLGDFAHNTGEGGLSPYHLEPGGDLVWQIGTGYFGCRSADGGFDEGAYAERASHAAVKMVELKISQGAKPGHGGMLPGYKVDAEVAAIRGVPIGQDVNSPPTHSAFSTPIELLEYLAKLRELSGGKPVGFKLCIGKRREFFAICKAMVATGILPDFITVDGGEGGTGAAPVEFTNILGWPLTEALIFVNNALVGINVRDKIKVVAGGKVVTGFDIAKRLALGADLCTGARSMMFALGCIQAQACNTNTCPTGVATQDPGLVSGLHVGDKTQRVYLYHRNTVHAFRELIAAAGLSSPEELRPWHLFRRVTHSEVRHYGEIYGQLEPGGLLGNDVPSHLARPWQSASADTFAHSPDDPHRVTLWPPSVPPSLM